MKFNLVAAAASVLVMLGYANAMMIDGKQMSIDEAIMKASDSTQMFELMHDENTVMVEMDMLYPMETYMEMRKDMVAVDEEDKNEETRKKRKAIRQSFYRWTGQTIPYEISYEMTSSNRQTIMSAIADYHKYTCLRFRPARSTDRNKIRFQNGGGCSSYVGMIGNTQPVSLAPGCRYKGIVIHEMGHAIGFHHEQTRPDRDNYVRIQSGNIYRSTLYNFMKYSLQQQNLYNVPYDYTSVMHYSQHAFSSNGRPTIYAIDQRFQNAMGNRDGLSFRDIQLANAMYECPARRGCASVNCPANSFQGPDCKCWCDSGNRASPVRECGGTGATTAAPVGTTARPSGMCEDKSRYCSQWKASGYCTRSYVAYMRENCRYSCNYCQVSTTTTTTTTTASPPVQNCQDSNRYCMQWARNGECERNPSYMLNYCKRSCEQCNAEPMQCSDRNRYCDAWAQAGYCTNSVYRTYLSKNCMKACNVCTSQDEVQTTTAASGSVNPDSNSECYDISSTCEQHRAKCTYNIRTQTRCRKTCGLCQSN